ncbi:S4 domain-containing protein [Levilactobacillus brevis]|uniref:S4 domain-containing protein n=1 Tax=Levilactobacillus brevis TaxID=1580 RepID=UPI00207424D7|nr:S4 domain-containing protein [Levilactobacillus brevis]MCM6797245.1 16S rRNA pseudouridylate synthase [Levilactobacillus brevis]
MNIERYLTEHHQGTPGQIFRLLRQGRVKVNDRLIDSPRETVDTSDQVTVDGLAVTGRRPQYLVFNKPVGVQTDLTPVVPYSLGSMLNALDQQQSLQILADLPRTIAGLTLVTDDNAFLTEVQGQTWPSTLRVQLTGTTPLTLPQNIAAEVVEQRPDQVHQWTMLTLQTTALDSVTAWLESLSRVSGAINRIGWGPIKLSPDLAVGTYRGLFPQEIDALLTPATTSSLEK